MRAARRQSGISLIELLISIAIGLFLLVGVISVFGNSHRVYHQLNLASQQIENGRFAVQMLTDDIGLAGFYGRYYNLLSTPGTAPDPCETTDMAKLRTASALVLQGFDATRGSLTCVPTANYLAGTDVLVVRRADSSVTAPALLTAEQVYIQANADPNDSGNPLIALGTASNFTLTNIDSTVAPIRKYHVHIYFISPCSIPNGGGTTCTGASDDGGVPIPTLKRLELTIDPADGTRKMVVTPLVEGIENLQIDYGLDSDNDGSPNGAYVTAPALTDWQNVVAVRINVLARNLQADGNFTDSRTYDLGVGGAYTPSGAAVKYKRHVYNAVIRVVNPSSRRDS